MCLEPSAWAALVAAAALPQASDVPVRDGQQRSVTAGEHETTGEDLVGLAEERGKGMFPALEGWHELKQALNAFQAGCGSSTQVGRQGMACLQPRLSRASPCCQICNFHLLY